jgi:chromosome segregation ATPase
MRLRTAFRFVAAVLFLGLTAWALPAQDQSSDDVAAAARKAREQQKNAPKPKKVLTNDDLPASSTTTPAPATDAAQTPKPEAQEQAAAAAEDQKKDQGEENGPKSEKYWRKRFQDLHDKLDQAQQELDVLQRELPKTETQYYSDPQTALMQQHDRSDINNKTSQIDAKKKEVDSLKQQLSDLEDEMRKAGGDPGWAR